MSLRKEVGIRKALFNQLQELRGNIRVICRVRPLCDIELDRKECEVCLCEHLKIDLYRPNKTRSCLLFLAQVVSYTAENTLSIFNHEKDMNNEFEFDCVFPPHVTQGTMFCVVCVHSTLFTL